MTIMIIPTTSALIPPYAVANIEDFSVHRLVDASPTVSNSQWLPGSINKNDYLNIKIEAISMTLKASRVKYAVQRECLKQVIRDLHLLDEVIRPQIEESEICSEMGEINQRAEDKLTIKLVKIPPTSCLKFCEETHAQLRENTVTLDFKANHLDFEETTLNRHQSTDFDVTSIREIIHDKKRAVQQAIDASSRLEKECNSVLDNEAKNIADSHGNKQTFDVKCSPNFSKEVVYPIFPTALDIAYDGVTRHRANLIATCARMLQEHVTLAYAKIWQKKSTA
ncbi:hypothetical protein BS639_19585 [Rouxiella silvae]|uniref:Uncharacterized protein n=1 Tax=Rouxiella silvae TaxID=1646373 RepID=A0ABX3TWF3_9GAMM|nr:hypothetical protein [Rouxiella silvae]ORJ19569.1 hypothetical protein BS639_19585 [Rouxiella silvae]